MTEDERDREIEKLKNGAGYDPRFGVFMIGLWLGVILTIFLVGVAGGFKH